MLLTVERVVEFWTGILAVALFNMSILRYTIWYMYSLILCVEGLIINQVSNLAQTVSGFI